MLWAEATICGNNSYTAKVMDLWYYRWSFQTNVGILGKVVPHWVQMSAWFSCSGNASCKQTRWVEVTGFQGLIFNIFVLIVIANIICASFSWAPPEASKLRNLKEFTAKLKPCHLPAVIDTAISSSAAAVVEFELIMNHSLMNIFFWDIIVFYTHAALLWT